MKKTTVLSITILCLTTLFIGILAPLASVHAQANPKESGQALEIAPPVLILKTDPGQPIETKLSLRNVSKTSLVVTSQVNDFAADGENGIPKIDVEGKDPSPYSIKTWVNPLPQLTLQSKQIKNLPITINVPANAAPGGYYGVVRFTATPPELEGTGVSLSASLGALIFIRVNGDAKESLNIESFTVSHDGKTGWLLESTPLEFAERIKNTGNVYEQPVGRISITDMFGKKIANVNVNLEQNYVLPQSTRKFTQPLDSSTLGNKWLFGRYKADLSITYGSDKKVITDSLTFWVIPWRLIVVIIIVLIGIFIAFYFLIRRYNRYVVKKAQGPRQKHKRHKK